MTEELKPVRCGCGGEATVRTYGEPETPYCIQCVRCGITTLGFDTEVEAIQAWNRAMGTNTRRLLEVLVHDATDSQYRDGWNDAMNYVYKGRKVNISVTGDEE